MALDSSDTAQDKVETRPVLIRASAPGQGVQHEVVARLDLVGGRFARTMVRHRRQCTTGFLSLVPDVSAPVCCCKGRCL